MNILKEIESNLIKNGGISYTSLDICIKKNKIFGILFISDIIPKVNTILQNINNLLISLKKTEDDILKLIICICDEEKPDYDKTFSKISNISCFILPFESEGKQKLINMFNIISLPCFIIFEKDGKILQNLNSADIDDINIEKVKGWKNTVSIMNQKVERYSIGDEGFIIGHKHILFYTDYLGKSPNYGKGNWYCDICGKTNKYDVTNFYCDLCGFDVCDSCYEKNKKLI